jgi:hypothetical protein
MLLLPITIKTGLRLNQKERNGFSFAGKHQQRNDFLIERPFYQSRVASFMARS